MIRRFVMFAALVLLAASCSQRDDGRKAPQRVELWTLALRPFFDSYIQSQIAAFEAQNTGVKVTWVDVSYDALERKLIAAAAADRAPDVVNMADLNFARFAALGAFADISGQVPGDADQTYISGALALCKINGTLMALPWYVNPQTKIMNADLLKKGSLSPQTVPASWSGLMELAPEFHARTGAYLFSQPLGEESQLPIMMLAEGLLPLKERTDGAGLEANLHDGRVRDFLARWVKLYQSGALPREAATAGHAHLLELYQNGRVAVISTGPNFLKRIRDVSQSVYAATTVREGAVGDLGRVHMPVMVLAVTKRSRQVELATRLAWFLTSAKAQTEFCKLAPIMPSSAASLDDPFFTDPAGGTGASETALGTSGEDATLALGRRVAAHTLPRAVAFTASLDTWPDLRRAFEDEFKRVMLNEQSLDVAIARIEVKWNEILSQAPPASMSNVPHPPKVEPILYPPGARMGPMGGVRE